MEEPLDFRQLISDRSILLNGRRHVVDLLLQMTYICVELAGGLCVRGQEAGSNWLSRHKDLLLVLPGGTSHASRPLPPVGSPPSSSRISTISAVNNEHEQGESCCKKGERTKEGD